MITKEKKQQLISKFAKNSNDVGSSEIQIAILTERIKNLTEHLKNNKKDYSTKRGLIRLVNRRKKLISYLNTNQHDSYLKIKKSLNLRG